MKKRIRGLDEMTSETKLNYSKILGLMACIQGKTEQLKMVELYRLLAKIKLSDNKRPRLLDFIFDPNSKPEDLWEKTVEELEHQEKNILRFSIIKDLLIIMRADYHEDPEEKKLLEKMKKILDISHEHMQLFEEEYKNDKYFFEGNEGIKTENRLKSLKKEMLAAAVSIGIPLTVMHSGSLFRDLSLHKTFFRSKNHRFKKNKHKRSYLSTGAGLLLCIFSYKAMTWILDYDKRGEHKLRELILQEAVMIHERAAYYLRKDLNHIENKIKLYDESFRETDKLIMQKASLEKVLAVYNNSGPKII